jgi:hypothetical protein
LFSGRRSFENIPALCGRDPCAPTCRGAISTVGTAFLPVGSTPLDQTSDDHRRYRRAGDAGPAPIRCRWPRRIAGPAPGWRGRSPGWPWPRIGVASSCPPTIRSRWARGEPAALPYHLRLIFSGCGGAGLLSEPARGRAQSSRGDAASAAHSVAGE